eukprot:m.99883 g.99883  ORF g.99883 m.99883 type:complete len:823 (-) comp10322_c0_seq1:319-2787(-)
MDTAQFIKSPKVEHVRLYKGINPKSRKSQAGTLLLTATHIIFYEAKTGLETMVLYMTISSVKKGSMEKRGGAEGVPIEVHCKDFQILTFLIPRSVDAIHVYESLMKFSLPVKTEELYAFQYLPDYFSEVDGWKFYNPEDEYARFGVPNDKWVLSSVNFNYEVCKTYTRWIYVPARVKPSVVAGSAKFRSKGRLPALSYLYKNGAAITRCAQPCSGINAKRNREDELLLAAIWEANPSDKPLMIVDTRPKINAVANKAKGKGFENMQGYPNGELVFHGIENIHAMRNSLKDLIKGLRTSDTMHGHLADLESSGWLAHIRAVLATTLQIVKYVLDGRSVVIHCSDGWDRTAQTCSLAGFMLEPYYRTIRGFIVLVEKEWLHFGHKMSDRNWMLDGKSKEVSPIFLQFLECTWQISQQYPRAFEFNELFLVTIHDCMVSSQFGTFLCNSEKERHDLKVSERTASVWSFLYSRREDFLNPLYDIGEPAHQAYLFPELGLQHYKVWTTMYSRFDAEIHPRQSYNDAVISLALRLEVNQSRLKVLDAKILNAKRKLGLAPPAEPSDRAATATDVAEASSPSLEDTVAPSTAVADVFADEDDSNNVNDATNDGQNSTSTTSSDDGTNDVNDDAGGDVQQDNETSGGDDVIDDPLTAGLAAFGNSRRSSRPTSIVSVTDDEDSGEWAASLAGNSKTGSLSAGKILAKSAVQLRAQTVKEEQKLKRKMSIMTVDVEPEKLELPVELEGNPFLEVESCHKCKVPFDFIALRQYCRLCGHVFCVSCTPHREPLPERGFEDRVPICEKCCRDRKGPAAEGDSVPPSPGPGSGPE